MIIGQSIYNVPVLTCLLEMEIFSIVEYQLKCCSVANDAPPDCRMVWTGAACCRQGHQRVASTAARLSENWWTTLWTFCSKPRTSLFDWFYCFMTLLRLRIWHAVKLLLALHGTVATCKAGFGELSDLKVSLQKFFWNVSAKNYNIRMASGKLVAHSKRATF